ncbi:RDD family protein [Mycolicibacterium litorale]|uniref:RDD family protein n=1 Tax=Mycolicibacterium litorale TaxID=758802 RepID=A0AAD1II82_9MYCO|nr:RDD family protein [Mycolicibacterium litorale]MCV7414450.1 RDD family protein [Mycolicibacterium litorale]TDY01435.1 RDD family protein [Mycolicibacterium litorale]BBY15351.1 RDD family protein [Mycolicibacterium litorale]
MARALGSWLSGPESNRGPGGPGQPPNEYPGHRLGLPDTGPGSIAWFGRRVAAMLVDWFIAYGLAALAMTVGLISMGVMSTAILVTWFVLGAVSVRLFGFTPGQYALGLMVVSVDDRQHVGFGRAVVRGLLIALVIPALFTDADLRGLHDLATKTAVVRR